MIGRSQGHLAAMACVLGFGACAAPANHTDLRTGGPPQVLTVLAADDPDGAGIVETATFCKLNDDKRPGLVPANPDGPDQVCPDDLTKGVDEVVDTQPIGWYVRIQFDELLNPNVEDLIDNGDGSFSGTLLNTQPVTLACAGKTLHYDGYYDPSGNAYSWPLGPSLFVQPLVADQQSVATGSECQVSINAPVVLDKGGNKVPTAQLGPYSFKIAPLTLLDETPEPPADPTKPATVDPAAPVLLTFNGFVKDTSLSPADVHIVETADCSAAAIAAGTPLAAVITVDETNAPSVFAISTSAAPATAKFPPSKTIAITFTANAPVTDLAGGPGLVQDGMGNTPTLCFQTDVLQTN